MTDKSSTQSDMDGGRTGPKRRSRLDEMDSLSALLRIFAQSKQRRVRRWLGNSRINVHRLYKPLIRAALCEWEEECIYLSLDTSLFWDEYCLIQLAVVHRGRALLPSWRVLKHKSTSVAASEYQEMLVQAAWLFPANAKVVLLADRGFIHTDAMSAVRQLGWQVKRLESAKVGDSFCVRPLQAVVYLGGGDALCHRSGG